MENLTTLPPDINTHWSAIAPLLTIRNEQEYEQAIERLNDLIDEIGTNEQHPLYNFSENKLNRIPPESIHQKILLQP